MRTQTPVTHKYQPDDTIQASPFTATGLTTSTIKFHLKLLRLLTALDKTLPTNKQITVKLTDYVINKEESAFGAVKTAIFREK